MMIPMPGHRIIDEEEVRKSIEALHTLVKEHDAVFLMTDSRESRWLPTLLGAAEDKVPKMKLHVTTTIHLYNLYSLLHCV
jgi:ubiquitin-like modifier-activating enzyme ATG7